MKKGRGVVDGINYINDTTVILCLYAPEKKYVFAIGDYCDWQVSDDVYMKLTPDSSRYWVEISDLEPGRQYIFQYLIDGSIRVGDIYAEQVSDPWNDKYISSSTYPDLPAYPDGKTSGIATVFQTAQQPYQWEVEDFDPPAETDLVVYEMLVRDFIKAHDFKTMTDTLDYFAKLGINAIELMPVSEFEGNSSWGYNPNYYFAPDKYYGPRDTYKKFIDECHKRGIAVIMDMVLNHAYGTCPLVMMYWDSQNNRPAANSPWFNAVCPHEPYCWGFDFNHKSKDTQNFVDSVNSYWLTEYKIDGFRFDFTKGFTNNGSGGNYDADRIAILKRMADKIWSVKPNAYVILEHFTDNSEEKVLANYGMMLWGNLNYNYNEATMGYNENGKSDFSWISYKKRGWNDPHVMGYMESHDEERLMFKNVSYGNSSGNYNIKDTATALQRQALAANFFFTVPGPKMIWQFGERGYDYSINWPCGEDNCRLDPKPPRWDYLEDWRRRTLMYSWSSLIELKKDQEVFKTDNFDLFTNYAVKRIRLSSPDMSVVILGNFDVVEGTIDPNFYFTGTWYDYWTGDSVEVTNVNEPIQLAPGEYRLYTSKKLQTPDFVGIDENIQAGAVSDFSVFPNPATSDLHIAMHLKKEATISVLIYDLQGKVVKELYNDKISGGLKEFTFNISGINQGLYFVAIRSEGLQVVKKLMIQ
ncbi:MAG: T9SS type A sorting domain-containing protein [Chlorobi bacterium]|nr:T9SS type A sorting domain-containing protein [Chlorobiota bacterium]